MLRATLILTVGTMAVSAAIFGNPMGAAIGCVLVAGLIAEGVYCQMDS